MQLTIKQEEGLKIAVSRYNAKEKYTIIAGFAGCGKAQPVNTIIPTPNGNKKLGELKIGDYVFDRLGKPTKVLGIYPQGQKEVYEVVLRDGRKTKCCKDHLWSYWTSKGNLYTKTTEQLLSQGLQRRSRSYKYAIPTMTAPVEFNKNIKLALDPYIVGAFLGDGCCKERQLTFSSQDEELVKELSQLLKAEGYCRKSEYNYSWTFILPKEKRTFYNNIENIKFLTKDVFQGFDKEIITGAENKRIPSLYKYASIKDRYDLVQGLLDTDGSISHNDGRFSITFSSISLGLIQDLQEVLYSLGYISNVSIDNRQEKYSLGVCYRLSINIPNEEKYKLFRLSRKKNIALCAKDIPKKHKYDRTSIVSIRSLKYTEEMLCIKVDNDEELYLTNDYIVTHNTTLVKFIISALPNIDPCKDVCYTSFTGKATQELLKKGNKNVSTLHKLLYDTRPMANGGFYRVPKTSIDYKIVVVDEISMVPKELMDLLLCHRCYVIGLGDPAQLPPVSKDADNHLLDKPHIFLDEIMRQAQDSEIIRLSMDIREGKLLTPYKGSEVQIIKKADLSTGMLTWADQILVGTNATRNQINNQMRYLLGRTDVPETGDKIICLRNYWEDCNSNGDPLVNGMIGFLKEPIKTTVVLKSLYKTLPGLQATVEDERGYIFNNLLLDNQLILNGEKSLTPKQEYAARKKHERVPYEFAYGYAITYWKSQGSEFDKVLVVEEGFPYDKVTHQKAMYTAVTRAKEKLVLSLKED